jgi:large subunit ribosomal protein L10
MNREEKQALVDELSEKFQSHNAFYIADASGMSVAKINDFRRLCFNRGLEFKVYKNSFIRKALDTLGGDTTEMDTALKGQSGVLFSKESGSAPAKLLKDFYKAQAYGRGVTPKPELKGAFVDSSIYIGADQLEGLTHPPKMLSLLCRAAAANWLVSSKRFPKKKKLLANRCSSFSTFNF